MYMTPGQTSRHTKVLFIDLNLVGTVAWAGRVDKVHMIPPTENRFVVPNGETDCLVRLWLQGTLWTAGVDIQDVYYFPAGQRMYIS